MSGPLTCLMERDSLRLGPDLRSCHVVFDPGCNAEDRQRGKDRWTGQDSVFSEEEE